MKANKVKFEFQSKEGICNWKGCNSDATYPAPKSRFDTRERFHFCLEHVRRYNKAWDFFRGMHESEVEAFHIDSITGHRKTFKRDTNFRKYNAEDLREELFREFNFGQKYKTKEKELPDSQLKYMKILGLVYPVTLDEVKKKYKQLAKIYHPDVKTTGDGDKFKSMTEAYNYLKNCIA